MRTLLITLLTLYKLENFASFLFFFYEFFIPPVTVIWYSPLFREESYEWSWSVHRDYYFSQQQCIDVRGEVGL